MSGAAASALQALLAAAARPLVLTQAAAPRLATALPSSSVRNCNGTAAAHHAGSASSPPNPHAAYTSGQQHRCSCSSGLASTSGGPSPMHNFQRSLLGSQPSSPCSTSAALAPGSLRGFVAQARYRQTTLPAELTDDDGARADLSLTAGAEPPSRLGRVRLRPDATKRQQRAVVSGFKPGHDLKAALGPGGQRAASVIDRLVGNLTKDGKKARAQRIVLDAMLLMRQKIAAGTAVDEGAAGGSSKKP